MHWLITYLILHIPCLDPSRRVLNSEKQVEEENFAQLWGERGRSCVWVDLSLLIYGSKCWRENNLLCCSRSSGGTSQPSGAIIKTTPMNERELLGNLISGFCLASPLPNRCFEGKKTMTLLPYRQFPINHGKSWPHLLVAPKSGWFIKFHYLFINTLSRPRGFREVCAMFRDVIGFSYQIGQKVLSECFISNGSFFLHLSLWDENANCLFTDTERMKYIFNFVGSINTIIWDECSYFKEKHKN